MKWQMALMLVPIVLAFIVLVLFLAVALNSPGTPKPFTNYQGLVLPNSISEKGFVEINGGRLGYFIKGKNLDNPMLLYLHGGMPDYFLTQDHQTGLDEIFTVVWWDQRGAGLSSNAQFSDTNTVLETMIEDTKEFTNYLRKRFSRDKIYLMAHSGGTYLGIKVIAQYPELFSAYLGVAQISNQKLSERMAFDYILQQYRDDKSKRALVEVLRSNTFSLNDPLPLAYLRVRDEAMHDLGVGTMRSIKNVVSGIFIPSLFFQEYSLSEKIALWKGKSNSGVSMIWNDLLSHNLMKENTSFKIPVYFFEGVFDYTCSYKLAEDYFARIQAPRKGFFTFRNSAHSPIFEEPQQCIQIIQDQILR